MVPGFPFRSLQRGMSLVEILVVMTVLGILLSLGFPTFQAAVDNSRVRSGGESILNGLQLARAEALKSNETVCFVSIDDTNGNDTNGLSWCVRRGNGACGVNEVARHESSLVGRTQSGLIAGALPLCYNGMGGRPLGSVALTLDLTPVASSADADLLRTLSVRVSALGQVRFCDPGLANTDPRSCG